jgi:putative ABC transport system permease protein
MPTGQRLAQEIVAGIKSLLLHKLRSVLTLLGLVFGVGSVIAMLAVGEGASDLALEQIRKLGSQNILVHSIKPTEESGDQASYIRMSIYGLTYDDHLRIRDTIPGVRRTAPVKLLRQEGQLGDRTLDLRLVGATPDWFDLVRRSVVAGRVLNQLDMERQSDVVVLTEHGARRLLATRAMIGQPIRIGGIFFEVVGIIRSENLEGASVQAPDRDIDAYIPMVVARNRFGDIYTHRSAGAQIREKVELHQIIVEANSNERVQPVADAIEYLLGRFHHHQDFRMDVPLALLRQAQATKRTFNIVLGSIAGISLLVGGIGIMNIMLATVTERTREIGIRRALGARRHQIIRQFLIETVVLSTTGGLFGIVVGLSIPRFITRLAGMPTVVTPGSVLLSLAISVAIGVIFGLYPAARAARLDPIIALRHE